MKRAVDEVLMQPNRKAHRFPKFPADEPANFVAFRKKYSLEADTKIFIGERC